jgi:hypothetical protein
MCEQLNVTSSILLLFFSVFIFYLKRWHIIKNSHGELQSVTKEDHPIDCSIEIDVSRFCSSKVVQPSMIDSVDELPNLKDLLFKREQIAASDSNVIEAKRPKTDPVSNSISACLLERYRLNRMSIYVVIQEHNVDSIRTSTNANYRLFAVINHHGGSSDVGKRIDH